MTFKRAQEERRMAQVTVRMHDLRDNPDEVQALFCKTLVLEARHQFDRDGITYLLVSPMFDAQPEGSEAPHIGLLRLPMGLHDWIFEFTQ